MPCGRTRPPPPGQPYGLIPRPVPVFEFRDLHPDFLQGTAGCSAGFVAVRGGPRPPHRQPAAGLRPGQGPLDPGGSCYKQNCSRNPPPHSRGWVGPHPRADRRRHDAKPTHHTTTLSPTNPTNPPLPKLFLGRRTRRKRKRRRAHLAIKQQAAAAQKLNCVLFLNVYLEALCPFSFPPRIQNVIIFHFVSSLTSSH
jgi:hypothetical protein